MKKRTRETDEPIGRLAIIGDFLPPPELLVPREEGVKVTLQLSKRSVDFFKAHAGKAGVPYQKMIRTVLDLYSGQHAAASRAGRGKRRSGF